MNRTPPSAHKIRILVHNCARSTNIMQSILDSAVGRVDLILLQEPFPLKSSTPILHPSFQPILPPSNRRQRTMAYISTTNPFLKVTPRPDISNDSDLQVLDVSTPSIPTTRVLNIYNEELPGNISTPRTIERTLTTLTLPTRCILAGDMNAHHPWWN